MKGQGISGTFLKTIAIVTMLIDHTAVAVLGRMLFERGYRGSPHGPDAFDMQSSMVIAQNNRLWMIYTAMRQIGRIAFPIFCFLLIEGLGHTRSRKKYALRMGLFALISEIPFDLAFNGKLLEFDSQNIFFTLFIGLVTMILLEKTEQNTWRVTDPEALQAIRTILTVGVATAGVLLAILLKTDYGGRGIVCMLVMYLLRRKRKAELIAGYLMFALVLGEIFALPAFLAMAFYRGKRGAGLKYFFYGFYPGHLLLLYLVCVLLGIAVYPAL